jgi:hypothetical protein
MSWLSFLTVWSDEHRHQPKSEFVNEHRLMAEAPRGTIFGQGLGDCDFYDAHPSGSFKKSHLNG